MKYLPLGKAGLKVSAIGLGTNSFGGRADKATSIATIHAALDAGVTLLDTANTYTGGNSESIIGEALQGRRHQALIATKAGMKVGEGWGDSGSSRHHLLREVEGSLRRLRTDYVDLYQIHRFDPDTPLEETLRTLDDLVRQGKVRYIGASNYAAWQLMKALGISERYGFVRFASIQPEYSLANRAVEREMIPLCRDQGIGLIPYFPLAGGILTGKYRRGEEPPAGSRFSAPALAHRLRDEAKMALAEGVAAVAREVGCTPAQLALAWLLHQPTVCSVIAGATRPSQVAENLGALDVNLPAEVGARLDELSRAFV
jgi:aryl-alcohol dehydrogenase-like predicted oxidoreductase